MQFKPHATEECTAGACSLWLHGGNTLRGWWREKKRRRKKEKMIKGKKKVSLLHNWHFSYGSRFFVFGHRWGCHGVVCIGAHVADPYYKQCILQTCRLPLNLL